ncbi:hypothetical protein ABK040_008838 [Willaertia magna]
MKTLLFLLATCLLVIFSSNIHAGKQLRGAPGTFKVWPYPETVNTGNQIGIISNYKNFRFNFNAGNSVGDNELLTEAIQRYTSLIFFDQTINSSNVCPKFRDTSRVVYCFNGLQINVNQPSASPKPYPSFGVDETYSLIADPSNNVITLTANTVWGALKGIETFSQLVIPQVDMNDFSFDGQIIYTITEYIPLQIKDRPRFGWRGFLVDTARHYYSVKAILQIIDALSYVKFNVLHWHLVDAQSFPLVVPQYPNLSGKGSYRKQAIYTPQDIQTVVEYARKRGMRVIPEIDVPGHAASWGFGYPEITANCPRYAANINNIPLNVASEKTYQVLAGIIAQLNATFPDQYQHIGGDEVVLGCFLQDPTIVQFMKEHNFQTTAQLITYFEDRLRDIYKPYKKTYVCWEELALDYNYQLPKDTIVHVWKERTTLPQVVQAGYQTLLSGGWYLDQQLPNKTQTFYAFESTWKNFYLNDPIKDLGIPENLQHLIIGGEGAMWSEQVDETNFHSRVFPRSLAIAERLWSPITVMDTVNAEGRLEHARCNVLVRRGIGAGPVIPGYCPASYGETV